MVEALFKVLEAGLSLWNSKEKTKYIDKMMALRKEWYEEYNKPIESRSDARLDNIQHELCIVAAGFSSSVKSKNAPPQC